MGDRVLRGGHGAAARGEAAEADGERRLETPRVIPLPKFSGAATEYEDWSFIVAGLTAPFECSERIRMAVGSLEVQAVAAVRTFFPEIEQLMRMTYDQFSTAMGKVFRRVENPSEIRDRVSACKLDYNVEEYIHNFQRCVAVNPAALSQADWVSAFITGSASAPFLSDALANANPSLTSLGQAFLMARARRGLVGTRAATVAAVETGVPMAAMLAAMRQAGFAQRGRRGQRGGSSNPPSRGQGPRGRADSTTEPRRCFVCDSLTHLARECPNKVRSYLVVSTAYVHVCLALVDNTRMPPARTISATTTSGAQISILIDSGAEANIIANHLADKLDLQAVSMGHQTLFEFADGGSYKSDLGATIDIKAGDYSTTLKANLCPLSGGVDVILGQPWLRAVNPTIDWQTGEVSIMTMAGQHIFMRRPEDSGLDTGLPDLLPDEDDQWPYSMTEDITTILAREYGSATEPTTATTSTPPSPPPPQQPAPEAGRPVAISIVSAKQMERLLKKPAMNTYVAALLVSVVEPEEQPKGGVPTSNIPGVARVLEEFGDRFAAPSTLPDLRPGFDVRIKLTPEGAANPAAHTPYRVSWAETEAIKEQLTTLLAQGLVAPSNSPFGAPVLLVRRADGGLRMCVDYRSLNKETIRDRFPLPVIEDLLNKLEGATIFSKVDLKSGFWQQRMDPKDEHKTAFTTQFGTYQFRVLPMGLANAPSAFQRLMQHVLKDFLDVFVAVYLDDIVIYSKNPADHELHVRLVLEALRKHQLLANASKCEFGVPRVDFLGHTVNGNGTTQIMEAKLEAVREWQMPRSRQEIRVFLGFCNFLNEYIPHYAEVAAPLTDALSGTGALSMNDGQRFAFRRLKQLITTAPVLLLPRRDLPFVLVTDASDVSLGAMLCQDIGHGLQPVAYASKKLTPAEKNYSIRDRELLGQVVFTKRFRIYLAGRPFELHTDHESLVALESQPYTSPRVARWAEHMAEFQYKTRYIPGPRNMADGLTHRPNDYDTTPATTTSAAAASATSVTITSPMPAAEELDELRKETYFRQIIVELEQPGQAQHTQRAQRFQLREQQLYMTDGQGRHRLCVPRRSQQFWLHEAHDAAVGGHQGADRTYERLAQKIFWPNQWRTVQQYVRSCDACQRTKAAVSTPAAPATPVPKPERPWDSISIDFMDLPLTPRGKDNVLIVTDRFSRTIHIIPTVRTVTAEQTIDLMLTDVVRLHGLPISIVSDRDARFTSAVWEGLWAAFGTKLLMSSAHRPQADGQSERSNRFAQTVMRAYVNNLGTDWDLPKVYSLVELAINSAVQADTQASPAQITSGRQPATPVELLLPRAPGEEVGSTLVGLETTWRRVKDALDEGQQRVADLLNETRKPASELPFAVGTEVLLHTRNYPQLRANKLAPMYAGPFKVTERPSPGIAQLDLPAPYRLHPAINVDQLKLYVRPAVQTQLPGPLQTGAGDTYAVERLLKRRTRYNKLQYLVRWQGYGPEHDSWEPASSVEHLYILVGQLESEYGL